MRVGQQIAVHHPGVIEQIRVSQVIPLTAGIPQVPRRAVLKTLEIVVHQDLLVGAVVVAGREIKPAASRAIVSRCRIVLSFPRKGLNPGGIWFLGLCVEAEKDTGQQGDEITHGEWFG